MPPMPPITRALLLTCVAAFCLNLFLHVEAWLALWPLARGRLMPRQQIGRSHI